MAFRNVKQSLQDITDLIEEEKSEKLQKEKDIERLEELKQDIISLIDNEIADISRENNLILYYLDNKSEIINNIYKHLFDVNKFYILDFNKKLSDFTISELEEVKELVSKRDKNALNTVGYKELYDYLDGRWSLDEAVERIKGNTRRYARKQLTWYKRDTAMSWFHPDHIEEILNYLKHYE